MIWVANRRTGYNMDKPGKKFRIDRRSPLGNPFRIGLDGTRSEVVEKYQQLVAPGAVSGTRYLLQIIEAARKGDVVLVCHCAPKLCHGDVIKEEVEKFLEE